MVIALGVVSNRDWNWTDKIAGRLKLFQRKFSSKRTSHRSTSSIGRQNYLNNMKSLPLIFALILLLGGEVLGNVVTPKQFSARNDEEMGQILDDYNTEASKLCYQLALVDWEAQTHLEDSDYHGPIQVSENELKRRQLIKLI